MRKPRISVILPTFSRAHCSKRAVHSVLAQGFDNWELILVDDGSDDETPPCGNALLRCSEAYTGITFATG